MIPLLLLEILENRLRLEFISHHYDHRLSINQRNWDNPRLDSLEQMQNKILGESKVILSFSEGYLFR